MVTNKTDQLAYVQLWAEEMNNSHRVMDDYEFSVTESLKDPTAIVLARRYRNAIDIDVQDTSDSNAGTAVHESLEDAMKRCGYITEQEISAIYSVNVNGKTIFIVLCGRLDGYSPENHRLVDNKNTKLATFNKNASGESTDWLDQLSIYNLLLDTVGPDWYDGIETLEIQARITDLSVVREIMNGNSPNKWRRLIFTEPREEAIDRALSNIAKAIELRSVKDEDLPICSEEYRFATSEWKIYKRKAKNSEEHNKTAVTGHAHYKSYDDALAGMCNAGFEDEYYVIDKVGGESIRCKYYCDLKDVCPHYKKMMEEN